MTKMNMLKALSTLTLCCGLTACGGGGGGGGGEQTLTIIDPTPVTSSNLEEYWDTAKAAWITSGASGGLSAVIAALEDESRDPFYDVEQVEDFILGLNEYNEVLYSFPSSTFAHQYTLTNVHKAWAAGLTGEGQTIAIFEVTSDAEEINSFDLTHPDLAAKFANGEIVGCFAGVDVACGTVTPANGHATAVAGIAAGAFNGDGIVGVAPDADLLLIANVVPTDFGNVLPFAIEKAKNEQAVALSNSWTFLKDSANLTDDCPSLPDDPEDPTPVDYWKCFYWTEDQYEDDFTGLLETDVLAVDEFQNHGVVIVSVPNEDGGLHDDRYALPADLPVFYEDLKEAWISVVNAAFEVDASGEITHVWRLSSPCNASEHWCLVGNGSARIADLAGGYVDGTGTSFVAPQVAGGVALLAEAFPTLNPEELTSRIFASANRDWFLAGSTVVDGFTGLLIYDEDLLDRYCWTPAGGTEICRWTSQEWGHGIMDLEAALSPIGELSLVSGASLSVASRMTISSAVLTVPTNSYAALQSSLSVPLTTFDALNGNFDINAASLVFEDDAEAGSISLLRRFERPRKDQIAPLTMTFGDFGYSATPDTTVEGLPREFQMQHVLGPGDTRLGFGFTASDTVTSFGGLAAGYAINPTGFAGLLGDTAYVSLGFGSSGHSDDLGGGLGDITLFAFSGENAQTDHGTISGIGARYGVQRDQTRLEVTASLAAEEGSYMGIAGDADIWFGGTTALTVGQVALQQAFGDGFEFTARAEVGSLSGGADEGQLGLISQMDDTLYSGFELALQKSDLFLENDSLALWVSQPMRVEDSGMTLTLASGRTKDGEILYQNYKTDLTPEDRQIDFGLSYTFAGESGTTLTQIGVLHSFNEGHQSGEHATSFAVRRSWRF